jgi:nucleotidyltransferase substrate binding protein (TIGR01987 family)
VCSLLDFTSLENSLQHFSEALQAYAQDTQNSLYRDACIHRFEVAYERTHKMLKRHLEMTSASPTAIDELAFPNLIRTANEQGLLLHDWERWKDYRRARSITSHTYDEDKAIEVMALFPDFFVDAQALLQELKKRNNP